MAVETVNQGPAWGAVEEMETQLRVLTALLQNTCCERAEGFATLATNDANWYLLHCAQLAERAADQAAKIAEALRLVENSKAA